MRSEAASSTQPVRAADRGANFDDFTRQLAQISESAARFANALMEGLGRLAIFARRSDLLESAGWLPHIVAPLDLIPPDAESETVNAIMSGHYSDHWGSICGAFSDRVESYDIDREAKATFRDALALHAAGHYRAVVHLLFPEIERVACIEAYGGKRIELWPNGKKKGRITSLRALRDAAGSQLGLSELGDIRYAISQFRRMTEHLYVEVGDDIADVEKYQRDPVPNRHAALHGIIVYKQQKNSINMLIMTDFMFGMIHALKLHHRERLESRQS